jgi:hypothetical protein
MWRENKDRGDRLTDKYYKKYGLIKTPIDFEFHLDENDVHDAERIDENVRIIQIKGTKVEFGFEHVPNDPKDIVTIELGFASVKVREDILIESMKRLWQRELADAGLKVLEEMT